jgi:Fe-S-cluster containining protein
MRSDGRPGGDWRSSPERRALLDLFAEADALVGDITCDASTDCCRFGVTGREPYVTAAEVAEIQDALKAQGQKTSSGSPKKRLAMLPLSGERRCPMLSEEGRCTVYDARPLGCRTFFCKPALAKNDDAKLPHAELRKVARDIETVSRRAFPAEQGTRPLTRALTRSPSVPPPPPRR